MPGVNLRRMGGNTKARSFARELNTVHVNFGGRTNFLAAAQQVGVRETGQLKGLWRDEVPAVTVSLSGSQTDPTKARTDNAQILKETSLCTKLFEEAQMRAQATWNLFLALSPSVCRSTRSNDDTQIIWRDH